MTAARPDVLVAAARGDDEALAVLVRAYHDRVHRFGRRVCRDGHDADDAVQEAFTKLVTRPDVVNNPGALSWLMTVVRHACLRLLRPFRRAGRLPGDYVDEGEAVASSPVDAQQALERWELVQRVHAAIATLEQPYREVLVMRDLEGLTGEETCHALGLELATMKTRLHRARGKLRQELERSVERGPGGEAN
jgi:RNA polymerase sigma-70 factor, ECF subfamily